MKLAVTAALFQPFELGCGETDAVMTGPVLSMLMFDAVAVALLPARSVE